MQCSRCGTECGGHDNFCYHCSTKLRDVCNCWVKKEPYDCGQAICPGYGLFKMDDIADKKVYSFTKERIAEANSYISARDKATLEHFGYKKPIGEVHATQHNKTPFQNIGEIIKTLPIDEGRKTRIIFDYDPDFAHCLLQINQSDELCSY